jgi:hypothetical protein
VAALLAIGLGGLAGCSRSPSAATDPAPTPAEDPATPPPDREIWEVSYVQGVRVGHARTTIRPTARDGRTLVRIECVNRLSVKRFGTAIEIDVRCTGLETPDGRLIEYTSTIAQGAVSMTAEGRVVGDSLRLKIATKDKIVTTSIPWSQGCGGFYTVQQSLARTPMRPGERRTLRGLEVTDNQVATTDLIAREYESVKLLTQTRTLLRIDTTMTVGNRPLRGALWADASGEIWKTAADVMGLETFRTTKELAQGQTEPAELDIAWNVSVPVGRALKRPHQTKRVRYRVQLDGGDPATAFVAGPTQQVRSLGAGTAEVTVRAIRPGVASGDPQATDDPPGDGDRRPNNWIQSDHPKIAAAAEQAAAGRTDPWQVALALEQATRKLIPKPGYRQAFDTAADVIESGSGDCTEHAVLLAALARARGIPARVAVGLVYVEPDQKFLYHMWDEVYVEGRWIPLDATLAQGGIGAAHLKLAHASFATASPFSSMLPVAQVAGKLKIEILEVE